MFRTTSFKDFMDDFAQYSYESIKRDEPDNPITYEEVRMIMANPESQPKYRELYEEMRESDRREEERKIAEKKADDEWLRSCTNTLNVERLKIIYESLHNIYKSWNDKLENSNGDSIDTGLEFEMDFVCICMLIAAADKEIEESEAAWLNTIMGESKTPAEYYKIFQEESSMFKNDGFRVLRSLDIALVMDDFAKDVKHTNTDNLIKFYKQTAKTMVAMDGKIDSSEKGKYAKMSVWLDKYYEDKRLHSPERLGYRSRIPEGYTGTIRIV